MRLRLHLHRSINCTASAALRIAFLCGVTALAACGGASSNSADGAVDAENSVCGTYDSPGVLKVTGLYPTLGASVVNRGIAHGFTVVNAPAYFVNFTFLHGSTHTASLSIPSAPKILATWSGNNLTYQFTVDSWSSASGHVELRASGGYETAEGCSWVFPSPLFSYDLIPVLDGGAASETKGVVDGGAAYDVPSAIDVSTIIDVPSTLDVPAEIDVDVDAPELAEVLGDLDSGTVAVDATLDSALLAD